MKFWSDFYALFDKIDKNGDGEIAVIECVALLDEKADKFGLGKPGRFFSVSDWPRGLSLPVRIDMNA